MRPSLSEPFLVFDLDDTLCLERDFAFSGYRAVGDWMAAEHGIAGFGAQCRALFEAGERRAIFDRALADLGGDPDLVPDLVARYRGHDPQMALCPDAARALMRMGGRYGLITDGPEVAQRAKIAALGLERWCDPVIPTGQWGADFFKPHPRAYKAVAAAMPGRRCVYIADNAAKDFVTPNRMGWATVQILRPERVHRGDAPDAEHAAQVQIGTLDALEDALNGLGL